MFLHWDSPLNSKLTLFLLMMIVVGCGVKGDPKVPDNTPLPSLLENYPDIKVEKPLNETKKR